MPYIVQCLDHEEGSGALWFDVMGSESHTRDEARGRLRGYRARDDEWTLYSYRVVEKDSAHYYSQPTDALEY